MSGSARVQSIQDLAELRAFLVTLAEKIREGAQTASAEANGTAHWIDQTQAARWKAEGEKSQRLLQDATEALRRKRMSPTTDGRQPNTMVEQKAQRAAKQRLEHAQAKAAAVKAWHRKYEKALFEQRRAARKADNLADVVIPQAIAYLEHLTQHLEKYFQATFTAGQSAGDVAPPADDQPAVALPMPDDYFQSVARAAGGDDEAGKEPTP